MSFAQSFKRLLLLMSIPVLGGILTSCDDSSKAQGIGWQSSEPEGYLPPEFETFPDRWNKKNTLWLEDQIRQKTAAIDEKRTLALASISSEEKDSLAKEIAEETRSLEMMRSRLQEGDYIQFKNLDDMPKGLVWEDGMDNPEIGDPKAKKGGTMRLSEPGSFPSTFRAFGPNSNNSFRGRLYDEIELGLVSLHPETSEVIPALACRWAVGDDGRTVYFKLFDDAAYSDGTKVKSIDFLVGMYITTSEYSQDVYHSTLYQENVSHITIYDDKTLSVTLPTPKPLLPYYAAIFRALPPHFYSEFGPNFPEKYQWRVPPTTGGYTLDADQTVRGRAVVMKRVKDWWAKDKKFYRYTNNVDSIVYNFISEESKALELFRIGELDAYLLFKPELWHDRMEIPEVHNGFIRRATFFTIYPRPPTGIFLNTAKAPFNDKNVRLGFQHSLNIQKIIDGIYRGDYQRLGTYASGYGSFSNSKIKAREYSPEKARNFFAKAGYTVKGSDGILKKPDGTRLSAEVTFANTSPSLSSAMSQLKEDCRKCGFDLKLDPLDSTVSYRKVMEKRHQSAFWSWGFSPPHPSLYQGFYSGYAYDSKGNVMPYTNNICSYSNSGMDKLLMDERDAHTNAELKKASLAIQQLIHDEAIWVPGWTSEFMRIGYWRWVQWPDCETTQFSPPIIFDSTETHLYWIDEDIKRETLEAKHSGKTFPEVDLNYEQYRFVESVEAPELEKQPQPEESAPPAGPLPANATQP